MRLFCEVKDTGIESKMSAIKARKSVTVYGDHSTRLPGQRKGLGHYSFPLMYGIKYTTIQNMVNVHYKDYFNTHIYGKQT